MTTYTTYMQQVQLLITKWQQATVYYITSTKELRTWLTYPIVNSSMISHMESNLHPTLNKTLNHQCQSLKSDQCSDWSCSYLLLIFLLQQNTSDDWLNFNWWYKTLKNLIHHLHFCLGNWKFIETLKWEGSCTWWEAMVIKILNKCTNCIWQNWIIQL